MPVVLCDERRRLLETEGHIVVRGGAGSGKTTISLVKASHDIEHNKLGDAGKALFLSFARATVARVAEQATATLPGEHVLRVEISTYHGFAWTVLKSHGYLLCAQPGVSLLLPAHARARLAGVDEADRRDRLIQLFRDEGLVAFDLFPSLVAELFEKVPVLAQSYARAYPLIIVDEFQDTNTDEWAMIKALGAGSTLIALGDPKQRIYDFKGADPRRFEEFIAGFRPTQFDFRGENRRSAGTQIAEFADGLLTGNFDAQPYAGVAIEQYVPNRGQPLRPLKTAILRAAARHRGQQDWSLAVLVPTNSLAVQAFEFMRAQQEGLPAWGIDILVAAEGPMLAATLVALLLEPPTDDLAPQILEALAAFDLGRSETASAAAIRAAESYRRLAARVRREGSQALGATVVGEGVVNLIDQVRQIELSGDPIPDWLSIRRALEANGRREIASVAKDARQMRLLRRGAQIESRLAEAWRQHGTYVDARGLLRAAVLEDQFAATSRPQTGAVVMTIHKSKGKEFDEVIVYEGTYDRFQRRPDDESIRSARFNLHVAATRARSRVLIMTPRAQPCSLLP